MTGKRILIADDEPYVTSILATKLRQAGAEVLIAHNGVDACALAIEHRPDLIVSDYQMPVLSGFEMSIKLKQDPSTAEIPVLMLTARGHHLQPSQLAMTNIQALMAKPFSVREVIERARELLELASAEGDA